MAMNHEITYERSLRSRAVSVVIALVLALAALAILHPWSADAASGTAGPATVTVTPTSGLNNGDAVDVTATFAAGSVFKMTAHLCIHGGTYNNDADFAFDGPWCSPNAVSPQADVLKTVNVAPSDTSASIATATGNAFHVGVGTAAAWDDFESDSHQLTCGPSSTCDLVVEVSITGGNAFYVAPLTFAGADTTTSSSSTSSTSTSSTSTSSTTTSSTTSSTSSTTTSSTTTSTTSPTTTTTSPTTTTAATSTTGGATTTTFGPATTTIVSGGGTTNTFSSGTVAGATVASGSQSLALTGSGRTRDIVSASLLFLAAGLFLLSASKRRASGQ
jgi:hypothetical protein